MLSFQGKKGCSDWATFKERIRRMRLDDILRYWCYYLAGIVSSLIEYLWVSSYFQPSSCVTSDSFLN